MNDIKIEVTKFLEARKQMVLATNDSHPWICTVYYVIDNDLNFYFLSSTETIHVQQLQKNNKVALTVADSPQDSKGEKIAIQLWGEASQVNDKEKISWFLNKWTDTPEKYDVNELSAGKAKGIFKVKPKQLKFFDTANKNAELGYKFSLEF